MADFKKNGGLTYFSRIFVSFFVILHYGKRKEFRKMAGKACTIESKCVPLHRILKFII